MTTHKSQDSDHEDYVLEARTSGDSGIRFESGAASPKPVPRVQDSDLSDYEGVLETVTGSSEAERIARIQKHGPKARTPVDYDPHGAKPIMDSPKQAQLRTKERLAAERAAMTGETT